MCAVVNVSALVYRCMLLFKRNIQGKKECERKGEEKKYVCSYKHVCVCVCVCVCVTQRERERVCCVVWTVCMKSVWELV